jgi:hypothetical protein
VYVGPTLAAQQVLAVVPGAIIHPPVAHGDLLRQEWDANDVVVIIDGYYHQIGSVRHKEVLALLAADVPVIGCASMGALRAAELHPFGMLGHGIVFQLYRDGVIDADDEVAVAHSEEPDYRRFGEPLVNLRHAVDAARNAGVLTADEATSVVAAARSLPYTARSWRATEYAYASVTETGTDVFGRIRAFLAAHPKHADIKAADAIDTLLRLDELIANAGDLTKEWAGSQSWRSKFLYDWQAAFGGTTVEDLHVSKGEVIRYCQIYDEGFPARWQEFTLAQIEGSLDEPRGATPGHDPTWGALQAAARHGVTPYEVTPQQLRTWLTRQETADMSPQDALVRMIVRSYRPPRKDFDLVAQWPDLIADAATQAAVAECHAVNAEVASWGTGQSIDHILYSTIRDHLVAVWRLADGHEESLLAASRDRGFATVEEAVMAARPYFLTKHFLAADSTLTSAEAG